MNSWGPVWAAEGPPPAPGEGMDAYAEVVGPGYFGAMRIPLVEGREFEERLREGARPEAVVINETLARRLWPGERNFVGRRMALGRDNADALEVVAVARDLSRRREAEVRYRELLEVVDKGIVIRDAEPVLAA